MAYAAGVEITNPAMKSSCHSQIVWIWLWLFCVCAMPVHANVYATDIRLNGSLNAGVIVSGGSLTISYILNDTATGGVSVLIYYGTNVVKTLASAGTNVGLNSVVWDGTTDDMSPLTQGVYTVSITASSSGYGTWTNITDDGPNFSVPVPRGITVDQNTNSPFYGRVCVGNSYTPFGIFKYNADGSPGDEGGFSSGGLTWGEGSEFPEFSPWKMAVSGDDKVYIDNFSGNGIVYEFDPTIETNHYLAAVREDNYPANEDPDPYLSGLAVTGTGTNTQIWMSDENPEESAGIIVWQAATNGVAASNDTGAIAVALDPCNLAIAPYDVALDTNSVIYAIQQITETNNSIYPILSFPPSDGENEIQVNWEVGSGDQSLVDAYGVAVDPTATFVAVAVVGNPTGGLYLYSAANGQFITNLDQTGGDPYYDVAWDHVGNLYALDGLEGESVWRVYSPPGTNQATTVAVPVIQAYNTLLPPNLYGPVTDPGGLRFTLEGQSNVTYVIQHSCDLSNWAGARTNYSTQANRLVYVPIFRDQVFYRAVTPP
jgi:hypothetical protein